MGRGSRGRRGRVKKVRCKKCNYEFLPSDVKPDSTWEMIAPMPDKDGNITVTVMAVWTCPQCGSKIKGALSKIKVGQDVKGMNRTQILIETLTKVESISIAEVAEKIRVSEETARKAIEYLLRKGSVKGEIRGNFFYRH